MSMSRLLSKFYPHLSPPEGKQFTGYRYPAYMFIRSIYIDLHGKEPLSLQKEWERKDREFTYNLKRAIGHIVTISRLSIMSETVKIWPRQARSQLKRIKGGDREYAHQFLRMWNQYSYLLPDDFNPPDNNINLQKLTKFIGEQN